MASPADDEEWQEWEDLGQLGPGEHEAAGVLVNVE